MGVKMQYREGGIAFFDSGIGGLTVLHACVRRFMGERFYYFGDNVHAPYGNKSQQEITALTIRAFEFFHALGVKAAVIACNTVTAVCAETLRKKYPFPIIGAEPAINVAAQKGGKVLVLATAATCESARFLSLCKGVGDRYPHATLLIHPCYTLAEAVERNIEKGELDLSIHIPTMHPTSVVLGCTHYIYIKEQISRYYSCPVFDGNLGISTHLSTVLQSAKIGELSTKSTKIIHTYPKSRDKQPLFTTNKFSCFLTQNSNQICFIGESKDKNKQIYERMFALSGK